MKLSRLNFWAVTVLFLLGFTALILMRANAKAPVGDAAPIPVPVTKVQFQNDLQTTSRWPAEVRAKRQSQLGFTQGGLLADIRVNVGDKVKKDDVLAVLDTRTLAADLRAAQAGVAQAKANRDIAATTETRQEKLLAQGHISKQRLDEVKAQLAGADAAHQSAKAQAQALSVRLDLARITAPYDGVITARNLDEGSIAGAGMPVLSIVETGALEVRAGLPLRAVQYLHKGDVVPVLAHGIKAEARFDAQTGVINSATQSVSVRFTVVPDTNALAAGESVQLQLSDTLAQRGFLVPTTALREGSRGLWTVYALMKPQTGPGFVLEPAPVEILHAGTERTYVRGPVEDGVMLLSSASNVTAAGMRVQPASAGEPAQ